MDKDASKIYLSLPEKLCLRKFKKPVKIKFGTTPKKVNNLLRNELVFHNPIIGFEPVPEYWTYEISNLGKTYLRYRREQFFYRYLPLFVSLAALLRPEITAGAKLLMRLLKSTVG